VNLGQIEIVPFRKDISREQFACGTPELDRWLREFAGQNENRFRTRTFLAVCGDRSRLAGHYATVFGEFEAGTEFGSLQPTVYKTPAMLIAKLAVDVSFQGKGIGSLLLSHALSGALEASRIAGLEVVFVDAKDAQATTFYGRFGFARIDPDSSRMFMTMKQIASQ
jgi:GNAT superfamily N-acetyltransferase